MNTKLLWYFRSRPSSFPLDCRINPRLMFLASRPPTHPQYPEGRSIWVYPGCLAWFFACPGYWTRRPGLAMEVASAFPAAASAAQVRDEAIREVREPWVTSIWPRVGRGVRC